MPWSRPAFLCLSVLAFAIAFSGCSSSRMISTVPAGPAPTVANTGMQVNGVAPNRWLYLQFNEAMNPSTINSQTVFVTDSSGTHVPGNVAYNSGFDVAGFQPDPALADNASYTLNVTTGVTSAQGTHLATAYTQAFTTRADDDKSPIYVANVSPAPNATCVSAGTPITITFSEGADISTLNSTNIVISGPGSVPVPAQLSYNVATAVATLTPSTPLPSGTVTVTVRNVADAAGVAMTSTYAWSFSTACNSGGGGTSGNATTQYQSPLLPASSTYSVKGQVAIDTTGNITIQLTGAGASTAYFAQFCPAVAPGAVNTTVPCVPLTTITTDASGNAKTTFQYPEGGEWAGDFYLGTGDSNTTQYSTYLAPDVSNETYIAALLPAKTVNGGVDTTATSQDPLASGTVSYSNGSVKFTVTGALQSSTYATTESETTFIDSSGTYQLSTFTTDASGNGSSTTTLDDIGGDLFQVQLQTSPSSSTEPAGFIGGFSIPLH
ncbi:MAG TPA: Ig-like domain-containing protein [Terracidiphilus sp.]|nr:Ig-like domain-containing protein [Terracidiphilus sp.]